MTKSTCLWAKRRIASIKKPRRVLVGAISCRMDLDPLATVKQEQDEDLEDCESVVADESEREAPGPEQDELPVAEQDPVFQPLAFVAVKEEPHDEMKRPAHQRNYGGGNICSYKECSNSTHSTRHSEPPVNFFRYPIRDIKRKSRVAPEQMSSMVAFMERHPALARGTLVGPHRRSNSEQLWKKLTLQLNASRKGPSKNTTRWQKTWADWKSTIKAKASKIRAHANSTTLTEQQVLTPLENRLLGILGREAAAGGAGTSPRVGRHCQAPASPPHGHHCQAPASPPHGRHCQAPASPPHDRHCQALASPPHGRHCQAPASPPHDRHCQAPASPLHGRHCQAPASPPHDRHCQAPASPPHGRHCQAPASPPYGSHCQAPASPPYGSHCQAPASPPHGRQVHSCRTEHSTSVLPQPVETAQSRDTSCTADAVKRDSTRLDTQHGDRKLLTMDSEMLRIKKERLEIEKERLQLEREKLQLEREKFEKEKDHQKQMEMLGADLLAYFKNS